MSDIKRITSTDAEGNVVADVEYDEDGNETVLVGPMSSMANAMARTSAGVSTPRLGCDCKNSSSGLPNSRRPTASRGRSGAFGSRTKIITLSGANDFLAMSASAPRVTRSSRAPRFSHT